MSTESHVPTRSAPEDSGLPRISIVIPSYSQASFLAGALDSLAAQAYPKLEVIVVDGGSADGTVELLKRRNDVVTRWVSEADGGQTNALNKGFDMAEGEVFGWLNCDERYRAGALRLAGAAFACDPQLEIVFGHRIVLNSEGQEIGRMRLPAVHPRSYVLYAGGLLFSDTTFWKAALHRSVGRLDEGNCPRYGMDFDWFGRLALKVKKWQRLEAYVSEFTEHEGRITKNVPEMPLIAHGIRRRVRRLARVGALRVLLLAPLYFFPVRYGRFGWRGLFKPPRLATLLRVAGIVR